MPTETPIPEMPSVDTPLTVRDLIALLQAVEDQNRTVILSTADGEFRQFDEVELCLAAGVSMTRSEVFFFDEEDDTADEESIPAVCLWPKP